MASDGFQYALSVDHRWTNNLGAVAAAAAEAGFATLGISATKANTTARMALAKHQLWCHDVLALIISDNEAETLAGADQIAAAAHEVGADWVLTIARAEERGRQRQLAAKCAAILADAGARMALEFSEFGPVPTIHDALDVIELVPPEQGGVLIDSWHFFGGGSTWAELETIPLERIAYLQFDDALPAVSDDRYAETMNRRTFPGTGTLDLKRFADTLLERDWTGVVSVEVLSADMCGLDLPEFCRTAFESTKTFWG